MKRIDNENLLDWYNTRAGRTIVKPKVGDHITANDLFGRKVAPKKKKTIKKDNLITFLKENYSRTHIAIGNKTIMLHKVITLNAAKKLYPDLKGVSWSDKGKYTKFYKV